MRSTLVFVLILSAWSALPLDACGDKFLLVGRGATFGRTYASVYPGGIIIYARDSAGATERTAGLRTVLTRAGHRVSVVSEDRLAAALQRGGTDIVIADGMAAPVVERQLPQSESKPTVLYVLMDSDKKTASKTTVYALKQSDKAPRVRQVIENAMKARAQAGTRVRG